MRIPVAVAVLGLVVAACGQSAVPGDAVAGGSAGAELPRCDELEPLAAPSEWYGDEPIYVGNEMPVEELQAWAQGKPGFEDVWIDRDQNGWVALAFSEQAEQRQQELRESFPDVGAVVVPVDWTREELERLQDEVVAAFSEDGIGSGVRSNYGVVTAEFGILTEDRLAEVAERFGDRPVCVSGRDPADVPAAGPQPTAGDGWRLLADEQEVGQAYRTWIATDEDSYVALWDEIGLSSSRPAVDFQREVVIWFGAVYGSSCPDLRLDEVVVDREEALVHAEIVLVDPPVACTDDANPHAYLVAVERSKLPEGPFRLQLDADDPPGGAPEERTYVGVDLSQPGAVAEPGDLRSGQRADLPTGAIVSGDIIETGYSVTYRMDVACGAEWLGILNDVTWQARDQREAQQVPSAWQDGVEDDGTVLVEAIIRPGSPPTATASLNGEELVYVPADEPMPACP